MKFCPKCGMRLILKAKNEGILVVCPKCGYEKPMTREETTTVSEKFERNEQESITVIDKEQEKIRTMPTTKIECNKCGNKEAYWWMIQTRGADEASTQFFRCTKCGHTWREND